MENQVVNPYYVDLHIHIGRSMTTGRPVKISGSRDLTFYNIAEEAAKRKGIEVVGIIDCHSPSVINDIEQLLQTGEMEELSGGGIRFDRTTVLLGSEIEVRDPGLGPAHLLVYMPTLEMMKDFSNWMSKHMKNVELSSQRIYVTARTLQAEVLSRGGIVIPAHVFTPHKSIYGSCAARMDQLLDLDDIIAVELGLSADSSMADLISELTPFTFVSNSDAHSLGKIGREYNRMLLAEPSYTEVIKALARQDGRSVEANYGLNPRLGKYHRTYCGECETIVDELQTSVDRCLYCGKTKLVLGVMDRIMDIADRNEPESPAYRPPYHYQVPLEFIPGLGKKTLSRLLEELGTEMNILHQASEQQLTAAAGEKLAAYIIQARNGTLGVDVGGGGVYGKVVSRDS